MRKTVGGEDVILSGSSCVGFPKQEAKHALSEVEGNLLVTATRHNGDR
jgi:hypothetical protein